MSRKDEIAIYPLNLSEHIIGLLLYQRKEITFKLSIYKT